jgi:hypothetical protein
MCYIFNVCTKIHLANKGTKYFMSLSNRVIIAIALIWVIVSLYLAQLEVYNVNNKAFYEAFSYCFWKDPTSCLCYNSTLNLISFWMAYSLPSVIIITVIWIISNTPSTGHLLIKDMHKRVSLGWLIITLMPSLIVLIKSYVPFFCYDPTKFLNDDHLLNAIEIYLFLQIPLFLYWLLRWVIKGNNIL